MIHLIMIIITLLIYATIFAQAPDTLWTKTFGDSGIDVGNSVKETSDGGYIIAGRTDSFGAGKGDVWLIKTDYNGDTVWTKTFGGSGREWGNSVDTTFDGGYIITGVKDLDWSPHVGDVWLVKTDAYGDTVWTKTYDYGGQDIGNTVQQTTDGGYIVIAYTYNGFGDTDTWLIKTDTNGDTLWTETFGGSGDDPCYSVQQTTDGGYIITGETSSYGAGSNDVWLIRTNASGNPLWTKVFGGTLGDIGYSVQQTTDGGYIITGVTNRNLIANVEGDIWLIRTSVTGDTLWTKTFGGTLIDIGYSVQQTTDGGYVITGVTDWHQPFGGLVDLWVIRTDTNGTILWTKTFGDSFYWEFGNSVQQTSDGGYIVTGSTESLGAGKSDVWLIKVAPDITSIDENPLGLVNDYQVLQNYPNPFNPSTTIEFLLPQSGLVTLKVYNILGEEVTTLVSERIAAGKYEYEFAAGNLASGIYLYRLVAGDFVQTRKMILMK